MNSHAFKLAFLCLSLLPCLASWGQDELRKGVTIIAAKEGDVTFNGPDGKVLPAVDTEINDGLTEGSTIQTGDNGKVVLLFSNGTVSTLMPKGKLTVTLFDQVAFKAAAGEKMSDLKEEPSSSVVSLNLDFGDLVVGTKKLNKKSSMDIATPTGTAGIRGTQFQVAQKPGGAMALDVTESTVAFTPKGAAVPTAVGPNRGLDVAAGGAVTARPVNPVVAQNVNAANTGAFTLTAEVSLGEVSAKVEESPPAKGGNNEGEEKAPEKEGSGGDEPGGDEPGGEKQPGGEGEGGRKPPEAKKGENKPKAERSARNGRPKVNQDQVVENNPEVKQVRKVGKLDKRTQRLIQKELTEEQMERFYLYPADLQDAILAEKPKVVQRLMQLKPSAKKLSVFYGYDPATRQNLFSIEDDSALSNFLAKEYAPQVAAALGTEANVRRLNGQVTATPDPLVQSASSTVLGAWEILDELRAKGNDSLLTELLDSSEGELTVDSLEQAYVGSQLLTDVSMTSGLDATRQFNADPLANPYYVDAASVWTLAKGELGLGDAKYVTFPGRNVDLSSGSYDYGPYLGSGVDTIIISSASDFYASGEITFDSPASQSETRVVLMSGGALKSSPETRIANVLSDLVLTSRDDLELISSKIAAGRRLQILGQSDVWVTGSHLEASESVRLQAAKDLNLDAVQFSQGLPSIYMQATTVNLRNLDFPGGSNVSLKSLKGAIDGKYPNFGTQSYGRVNFIENVKYGGNLMNDRPSFDQFGGNVTIGKSP